MFTYFCEIYINSGFPTPQQTVKTKKKSLLTYILCNKMNCSSYNFFLISSCNIVKCRYFNGYLNSTLTKCIFFHTVDQIAFFVCITEPTTSYHWLLYSTTYLYSASEKLDLNEVLQISRRRHKNKTQTDLDFSYALKRITSFQKTSLINCVTEKIWLVFLAQPLYPEVMLISQKDVPSKCKTV